MILNSLLPVFILLALGNLLKHYHLTNDTFLKTSDRLVYFIFFPVMLFWKIGGASSDANIQWHFCMAAIAAVFILYAASLALIRICHISDYQAGSFSQSCYRFNTYIGMAIVINALGEEGVRLFGILIGFVIPTINVLAVSTLIWYSGNAFSTQERVRLTVKSLISNPLILACLSGILYAKTINTFPMFLENTFRLISMATLPLALISIGGALTFANLKGYFKISLLAAATKLVFFPVVGYLLLKLLDVSGLPFHVAMIFFATPTATSVYVLSSQLNSDTSLASAAIVLSTLLSFFSFSVVMLMMN